MPFEIGVSCKRMHNRKGCCIVVQRDAGEDVSSAVAAAGTGSNPELDVIYIGV